jgi:hypothetical protein
MWDVGSLIEGLLMIMGGVCAHPGWTSSIDWRWR